MERIRRQEYRYEAVKNERGTWSAPNRAQGLRSRVSERGLEVFPRATGADGAGALWKLSLATASFGRTDGAFELPRASVSATDERVELDNGFLVEWFVNDERGIEQGWTIPERLIGSEALSIGLAIEGELSLRIEEGGRSGVLVDACGEAVLRYRDLRAFDATGRELEARIVPARAGVAIEVDDLGAVYPLTVDPLLTGPAWTAEPDKAAAAFGASVSAAGDVNGDGFSDVIVGAYAYDNGQPGEGRAFVYSGSASGLMASAAWSAESDQAQAFFGRSVSTAGDVNGDGYSDVIVGAPYYDNGQSDEGRAFVYLGSASGLAASAAWTAESDQASALFAWSAATAGDVNGDGYSDVVVGAHLYDNGQSAEGRAFVYHGSAGGLSTSPSWTAESDHELSFLGISVSTAGDVNGDGFSDVIVGAPFFDPTPPGGGWTGVHAALVYLGSSGGLSSSPDWFAAVEDVATTGFAVSTAGDVNGDGFSDVIVGAPAYSNGQSNEGGVLVYHGSPAGLSLFPNRSVESNQTSANLGNSVSSAGDVNGDGFSDVIVGALAYDGGQTDEGRAQIYYGSPSGLLATPAWSAESDQTDASFGTSVSSAGDVNGDGYSDVIVGASGYDNGQLNEGRAYVYHGSASGLAANATWTQESNQADALFGVSVASAGDVNGDGYSDVIVGAYAYDGGQTDEGRAFLYDGSAIGPASTPSWTAESDQASAFFGVCVATSGDVNGDGYSDVIVGAYGYDGGQTDEGRAYVFLGSATGLAPAAAWTTESDQAFAFLGFSVAAAGDVNGDGYGDAIVGAFGYDGAFVDEGGAKVFLGSPTGLEAVASWSAGAGVASSWFGHSVSMAGDVNADGYSDVIIGADVYDDGQLDEGAALVYHGSPSGLAAVPAWSVQAEQSGARLGASVATAGDVNGDGYSDVIVGAYLYDNGESDEGCARVYHGSANGLSTSPAWTAESNQTGGIFGSAVATAGDVNGDGYSDVVVGAVWYDAGETDEGRAFVYHGSASGLAASAAWIAESNQASALFGTSVASAGDVNGDGYSDVVVGAPYFDHGEGGEGRVWVYLGNDGRGGPIRRLQQRTHDGQAALPLLGAAGASGAFRIHGELAGVPGASTARLEWEVKPLGVPFNGHGIESGAPLSGPGGAPLIFDESVNPAGSVRSFATRAGIYCWRVRVATDDPLYPHTPWFSVPGNAVTEAKLRKSAFRFP